MEITPGFHESIVVLGSALAYTIDHWDDFAKEFGTDFAENEDKGMDEVKEMFIHLFADMADELERRQHVKQALKAAERFFRNMQ